MANELKHGSVGTELTQAEWEGIGTHVIANQAVGDIIYASTTSQLSRLGKGTDTHVLILSSGIPAWSASTGITAVGTIATGVWQGTDVGVAYGGTGVSTLTSNAVLTGNGASAITAEANLTFDGSTLTLDGDLSFVGIQTISNTSSTFNIAANGQLRLDSTTSLIGINTNQTGNADLVIHSQSNAPWATFDVSAEDLAFAVATSIKTTAGDLTIDPAASLNVTLTDDDSDALDFANSATSYLRFDTRNTVATVIAHHIDTEDATIASASDAVYGLSLFEPFTLNYTGTTQVTGLQQTNEFGSTTIAGASALTVDKAATIVVAAPIEGTNVTLGEASAIRILNTGGSPTNLIGLYIEALSSGATDYAVYMAGTPIIHASLPAASAATNISLDASNNLQQDTSSERFKNLREKWKGGADFIRKLTAWEYDWKEGGSLDFGLTADDVYAALPEAATVKDGGPWSIRHPVIEAALVDGFQEHDARLRRLEERIA
jgi:hypothetical protein